MVQASQSRAAVCSTQLSDAVAWLGSWVQQGKHDTYSKAPSLPHLRRSALR